MSAPVVDRDSIRGVLLQLLATVPDDAEPIRDVPVRGERRLAIAGELVPAASGAMFPVVDPASGQVVGEAGDASIDDVSRAIASAREAFDTSAWSLDHSLRARCLRQLQEALRDER